MGKLKLDRKRACSPKSIDRIFTIVSENWDEVWDVVQLRAQADCSSHPRRVKNPQFLIQQPILLFCADEKMIAELVIEA